MLQTVRQGTLLSVGTTMSCMPKLGSSWWLPSQCSPAVKLPQLSGGKHERIDSAIADMIIKHIKVSDATV